MKEKNNKLYMSEAEKFAIELRTLCSKYNIKNWSLLKIMFNDGSSIGNTVLWKYALRLKNNLNNE